MMAMATKKLKDGYVPPLVRLGRMTPGVAIETVVAVELIADFGEISHPLIQTNEELDCKERKERHARSHGDLGDSHPTSDGATDWTIITSDSSDENLLLLTCG